jgi:hypothetical protein
MAMDENPHVGLIIGLAGDALGGGCVNSDTAGIV